jgi:hypothetical protein
MIRRPVRQQGARLRTGGRVDEVDLVAPGGARLLRVVADEGDLPAVGREHRRRVDTLLIAGKRGACAARAVEQVQMSARGGAQVPLLVLLEVPGVDDDGLWRFRILGCMHDQHGTPAVGGPGVIRHLAAAATQLPYLPAAARHGPQLGGCLRRPRGEKAHGAPIGFEARLAHALPARQLHARPATPVDDP